MVDVAGKPVTAREAVARGTITMSRQALQLVRIGRVKKGDPLQTARLAGILAAKQTSALIPLCHPLPLTSVDVDLMPRPRGYDIDRNGILQVQMHTDGALLQKAGDSGIDIVRMPRRPPTGGQTSAVPATQQTPAIALDVLAPDQENSAARPVLMYAHGGAFTAGATREDLFR